MDHKTDAYAHDHNECRDKLEWWALVRGGWPFLCSLLLIFDLLFSYELKINDHILFYCLEKAMILIKFWTTLFDT